jgi:Cdc6-like AAA superfamily ATPase
LPQNDIFTPNTSEFIQACFVDASFDEEASKLGEELNELKKKESSTGEVEALHEKLTNIRKKASQKNNFENSLFSTLDNPIYIRGFTGTGKTTYINTLLYKHYNSTGEKYETFDLIQSLKRFTFLSHTWENPNFVLTIYKFISILMYKLNEYLKCQTNELEADHKKRMALLLSNYYKYFFNNNVQVYKDVFRILDNYTKQSFILCTEFK